VDKRLLTILPPSKNGAQFMNMDAYFTALRLLRAGYQVLIKGGRIYYSRRPWVP
jgi:hypothetical protein